MPNIENKIPYDRSVLVATDVKASLLQKLVDDTKNVEGIGGYKIGMQLALTDGLSATVARIKDLTSLPIIFDYQKAGNDIPKIGNTFAEICREAGVDAAILFPFGGGQTVRDWIHALQDQGVGVLVGAHMTQPEFLWDEGGVIHPEGPVRIFEQAVKAGVTDFVVPGNKVSYVEKYRTLFDELLGPGNFSLYAPGFITQGGSISEMAQVAGPNWHAIVGSGIYKATDMRAAAIEATSKIT